MFRSGSSTHPNKNDHAQSTSKTSNKNEFYDIFTSTPAASFMATIMTTSVIPPSKLVLSGLRGLLYIKIVYIYIYSHAHHVMNI